MNKVYDWGKEELYERFFEVEEADWLPDGVAVYVAAQHNHEGDLPDAHVEAARALAARLTA